MPRPRTSSTPLRGVVTAAFTAVLGLTVLASFATDSSRAASPGAAAYRDNFERAKIGSKLKRTGRPRLQRKVRHRGRRALMTPRARGAHRVTKRIRTARQVRVDVWYRRASRGRHGVIRLHRNKIELVDDGRRLHLVVKGRSRPAGRPFRSVGRWVHVALVLDGKGKRVIVGRNRKKVAARRVVVRRESAVSVGTRDGRRGPGYYDSVRVVTGIKAQPKRTPSRPGGGISRPGSPGSPGSSTGGAPSGARFFAPGSFLNKPLADNAALDPNSANLVADLVRQVGMQPPTINSDRYSAPIYQVSGDYRRIKVALDADYKDPRVLSAFASVPVPRNAEPANGTDKHLVVWQPDTDTMWEFWNMRGAGDSWTASHGAKISNVSRSNGVAAWPQGATATGIALVGGTILLDELEKGRIDHALAMAIPEPRKEWFTAPANRTDGHVAGANIVPEGARFRLPADLDLDSLNLPRQVRILAEAAQRYGIVVRDHSGVVAFYGEDPRPSGRGGVYDRFYAGTDPIAVMRAFPWDRLQVLKMNLRCCWDINNASGN